MKLAAPAQSKLALGDAQPAWKLGLDGRMDWGPGGAGAVDTSLYRTAANELTTGGNFAAPGWVAANRNQATSILLMNDGRIYFGSAYDTNLYRGGANSLKTDGQLIATELYATTGGVWSQRPSATSLAFATWVGTVGGAAEPYDRWDVQVDGKMRWGPGNVIPDTNLYRLGADYLYTDDSFGAAGVIVGRAGGAGEIRLAHDGTAPKIMFGPAQDTSLYRSAAGTLRTDGNLSVGGSFTGAITDANLRLTLHRDGGDYQPADLDSFVENGWGIANGVANVPPGSSGQFLIEMHSWSGGYGIQMAYALNETSVWKRRYYGSAWGGWVQVGFGDVSETTFYRSSAQVLSSNASIRAGQDLRANSGTANQVWVGHDGGAYAAMIRFGPGAGDTSLFRQSAGILMTQDHFRVGGYVDMDQNNAGGQIRWGSALDTNLYRSAAGQLTTGGGFTCAYLYVDAGNAGGQVLVDNGGISFGTAGDALFSRMGAGLIYALSSVYTSQVYNASGYPGFFAGNPSGIGTLAMQGYLDGGAKAALGHNAHAVNGGWRWAGGHSTFGSRIIEFAYESGIGFYADNAAATMDAAFTPSLRFLVGNDGAVRAYGDFTTAGSITSNSTIWAGGRGFFNDGIWVDGGTSRFIGCNGSNVGIYNAGWRFNFAADDTLQLINNAGRITIGGDVNLYRNSADVLKTDDNFVAGGNITSVNGLYARNGASLAMYGPTLNHWQMLAGSGVYTMDGNSNCFIPYPQGVSSTLTAVAVNGDYNTGTITLNVGQLTPSGFFVKAWMVGPGPIPGYNIRINWTALVAP